MKPGWKAIASLAITLAFVLALLLWVDWRLLGATLRQAALLPVLAGLVLLLASYAVRVSRLAVTLSIRGGRAYLRLARLVLVHNALVNLLPMRGGDLAFPLLLKRDYGTRLVDGAALILWLRLQDALVLLTLVALVWPGLAPGWKAAALIAAIAAAAALPWTLRRANLLLPRPLRSRFARALRLALLRRRREWLTWTWTVINWTLKLAAIAWLLAGFAALPVAAALAGAAAAEGAALLPVQGVAGVGTYEGAIIAALSLQGIDAQIALAAALATHAVVLASSLLAAAALAAVAPMRNETRPSPR